MTPEETAFLEWLEDDLPTLPPDLEIVTVDVFKPPWWLVAIVWAILIVGTWGVVYIVGRGVWALVRWLW